MHSTTAGSVAIVNRLIEVCKDGEAGFHTVSEHVKNSELKTLFHSYSEQRAQFAKELQAEVSRLGCTPERTGSMSGTLHRGWVNLKSAVVGMNDACLVAECERSDEMAKKEYEEALKAHLSVETQGLLQRHYAAIKEALNRIRALETAAAVH
jgi:uncharacterized protein (TIGR02284 family)